MFQKELENSFKCCCGELCSPWQQRLHVSVHIYKDAYVGWAASVATLLTCGDLYVTGKPTQCQLTAQCERA